MASMLVCISPDYIPLAFTTHFLITVGYWSGKMWFSLHDTDDRSIIGLNVDFVNVWSNMNHSMPLLLLVYKLRTECVHFTYNQWINS